MDSTFNNAGISHHQMLKTALFFGFGMELFNSLLIACSYLFGIDRIEHQPWFSSCFLLLLALTLFLSFRYYSRKYKNGNVFFSHLVILTLLIGFIVGGLSYLSYFIEATYIDPEFSQRSLEASRQHWIENNYSDEAIAGQVELSESFHNPAKWGFFSGMFIMALSTIIGLVIATFQYLINHATTEAKIHHQTIL